MMVADKHMLDEPYNRFINRLQYCYIQVRDQSITTEISSIQNIACPIYHLSKLLPLKFIKKINIRLLKLSIIFTVHMIFKTGDI